MRKLLLIVAIVIAVAVIINGIAANRETKAAKADIGRILELPGGDLQVRERGPADAPAILLVHCYTCSMRYWQRLEPLLTRDRRVISVDLLGHGGSEMPKDGYSMEHQADTIAQALEALDAPRVVAVGQSLGGPVATALAQRHPGRVRGLVIMDSSSSSEFVSLPFTARIARTPFIGPALQGITPDSVFRSELSEAFAEGFEVPDELVEDIKDMTFTSFRKSAGAGGDFSDEQPLDERVADTGLPVTVIFGAEDRIVDPKSADEYRDIPGARVVVLPGIGHTPQMEAPAKAARLVRQLDRRARGSRARP